jgi:PTS system nitrogen regulatory IIA component
MGHEAMDLDELARYLGRDPRELGKLVGRGQVPGHKVGGRWRFVPAEIRSWLEPQLATLPEDQLKALDAPHPETRGEPLLRDTLAPECVAMPLAATTRAATLRALVTLAGQTWQLYDPEAVLAAVQAREAAGSTALPGGVAVPHPGKPMPDVLGGPLVAFGRTAGGLPFGAADRGLTDLFFLVLADESRTHLRLLARLMRLFQRPDFLPGLRDVETAAEAHAFILAAEADLP